MATQSASFVYNTPTVSLTTTDPFGNTVAKEGLDLITAQKSTQLPSYKAVVDPWNKVYYSETPLSAGEIPKGYTNKVQSQMFASFGAHEAGWNKYFESSYKSPRIAEDNARIAQQNNKATNASAGSATGNQLVPSNLGIRKESGTGVGRGTMGLNPFGQLDSGLNI